MTIHIPYDHNCANCGAQYIPYDEDIPCPRCGQVESEIFDYATKAADSLAFNLDTFSSYTPPAWAHWTLGDYVLMVLFSIFEQKRLEARDVEFSSIARRYIDQIDFKSDAYLADHILAIAERVRENLDSRSTHAEKN